jgi:hypothetical protein
MPEAGWLSLKTETADKIDSTTTGSLTPLSWKEGRKEGSKEVIVDAGL